MTLAATGIFIRCFSPTVTIRPFLMRTTPSTIGRAVGDVKIFAPTSARPLLLFGCDCPHVNQKEPLKWPSRSKNTKSFIGLLISKGRNTYGHSSNSLNAQFIGSGGRIELPTFGL